MNRLIRFPDRQFSAVTMNIYRC